MQPNIQIVESNSYKTTKRRPRKPAHPFNVQAKPFEIAPFFIAPVLPGETLQKVMFQSRAVTDPIKNRLVGWHKEYYYFYVPILALEGFDPNGLLRQMMLDPTTDVSSLHRPANVEYLYGYKGGMDYVKACRNAVIEEWFRDEDEDPYLPVIENHAAAQMSQRAWFNSIKKESAGSDDADLPGMDELEDQNILPSMSAEYLQWEMMKSEGQTDLDFDDFIRSYGVSIPESEEIENPAETKFKPELIRYHRDWSYPSNTIDPTDGSAVSAVSWSIAETTDKRRFFKYPGFIFGMTVTRPKLYLGNQKGAAVGFLNNAYSWLPAVLHGHVYSSIKEIEDSATDGIFQNQTEDYWFDCKDLFLHGDQFINFAPDVDNAHAVSLPDVNLDTKYPTEAMMDDLFAGAGKYVREDGMVMLNILAKLDETTPS